ncbi:MAG: phage terminase large subunit [Clostridia bacterium]|nr:phage terminase large subunit [Clostridia bacterium]
MQGSRQLLLDIRPSEKQRAFFSSSTRYTAYGGARGGGKSWALRNKLVLMCLNYPGISTLLVRRSYPEVIENHKAQLMKMLCGEPCMAAYKSTEKVFEFINGSRIKLGYFSDDDDVMRYQGQEFDVIAIDEATQISEQMFRMLSASVRGTNGFPKRIYLSCNPGGIGHGWVKRLFIDKDYTENEDENDYTFVFASVYDNDALMESDPNYVKQLKALPPDIRRAWLDGDWNIFSGRFFPEFSRFSHVCQYVPPEKGSTFYCAVDYGLDMLAAVFIAVKNGEAYVYDEIYESSLIASDAAAKIKAILPNDALVIAPADLWSRQKDSGLSIAEIFSREGVFFTKLSPQRISGWLATKEWLKKDADGKVGMVISDRCKNLIRSMEQLTYDEKNACDAAKTPHEITHAPDALRYFASFIPRDDGSCAGKLYGRQKKMKGNYLI